MTRILSCAGSIIFLLILTILAAYNNGTTIVFLLISAALLSSIIEPYRDNSHIRTRSHVRRIRRFSEALSRIGPHSQYEEVARLVVESTSSAMSTDKVALFTIDSFTGEIQCDSANCVDEEIRIAFLDLYGNAISDLDRHDAWTILCSNDTESSVSKPLQLLLQHGIHHIVAAPIRSETSTSGVLTAFYGTDSTFEQEFPDVLEAIAAQVSTTISFIFALEQSQFLLDDLAGANQELSVQATVDGLTGLTNHRALQQKLSDLCVVNSKRDNQVFSLVMLDVDHFKLYNDTHGHQEGDRVLRKVAKVLASSLRQEDLAARYGGEEFALILRGIGKDKASGVADRIRSSIANQSYRRGSVTVSMGVAQFPEDGTDPGDVIEKADRALYHAKIMGRNKVVVWGRQDNIQNQHSDDVQNANRKTVLTLINPDESCADLTSLLTPNLYSVVPSTSIKDATNRMRKEVFDIALISHESLPNRDINQLNRLTSIHPDMPVILIADNLSIDAGREALRSGASDILERTCNPSELPLLIERNLERRRIERQRMMQKNTGLLLQAIEALVAAIDAKDHYTAGHSNRVCSLALAIGDKLSISNEDRYALELASKLHDVGKLALPESALNKDSQLTDTEWQAMREHPILGSKIVCNIDELAYVGTIIRHHHERLDGSGYPDGLQGQTIPYLARIIAVADAYEAMTSKRAHRAPMSAAQAISELRSQGSVKFSQEIILALEQYLIECEEIGNTHGQHRHVA